MFALNLRYLREKYHLQRRDIAALTGVNNGTVAMWEDGYDVPGKELIIRISDYFRISEKDLKRKNLRVEGLDGNIGECAWGYLTSK